MFKKVVLNLVLWPAIIAAPMLLCWGIGYAVDGWAPPLTSGVGEFANIPPWTLPVGAGIIIALYNLHFERHADADDAE